MENTSLASCYNCSNPLPERAKFCGSCRTQVRCKECNALLEKDVVICIECGTDLIVKSGNAENGRYNTISIHETLTERNIEATFSDNVGKELTGILRDAMMNKRVGITPPAESRLTAGVVEDTDYHEVPTENGNISTSSSQSTGEKNTTTTSDLINLSLETVAMRALPASEREWVLLYCYYASAFGTKPFTREDVVAKYNESGRWDDNVSSALSGNMIGLGRAGRLNKFGGQFSILESGITLAKEILSRTTSTPLYKKGKKGKESSNNTEEGSVPQGRKKGKGGNAGLKRLNDIDFQPDKKEGLSEFYNKYAAKSDYQRILLFVYYMQEVLKLDGITYSHIYTCFETLNLKTPLDVAQIVRNCASREGWINSSDSKNIVVTTNGRNQIKAWNKNEK